MHLAIHTQKRERPLILRLSLVVFLSACLALCGIPGFGIYKVIEINHLYIELQALSQNKGLLEDRIAGTEEEISALRERIRYVRENPFTPEIIFKALDKLFSHVPTDTVKPFYQLQQEAPFLKDRDTYGIQVSSHRILDDAEKTARDFKAMTGHEVRVEQVHLPSGTWFRVLLAPFLTRDKAELYAEKLKAQGKISKYYVHTISPPGI